MPVVSGLQDCMLPARSVPPCPFLVVDLTSVSHLIQLSFEGFGYCLYTFIGPFRLA